MRNFQQKRGFRNIIYSKPVLVLLGILVLLFAYGVVGFMRKMTVTIENKKMAENKVMELRQEKEKLSSGIAKLQTESGVEESIRDKFGLAKEGEGLIVVVDDENTAKTEQEESGGFLSFLFFWRNWLRP